MVYKVSGCLHCQMNKSKRVVVVLGYKCRNGNCKVAFLWLTVLIAMSRGICQ